MKRLFSLILCFCPALALANNFKAGGMDFDVEGGVSLNVQYLYHTSNQINQAITDEEIGLSPAAINDIVLAVDSHLHNQFSLHFAFGHLLYQNFVKISAPIAPLSIGLLYGWVDYHSSQNFNVEIGQLQSLKGLEEPISYKNNQILRGAIHRFNPTYYPGFRLNYRINGLGIKLFAELGVPRVSNDAQATLAMQWSYADNSITAMLTNDFDVKNTIQFNAKIKLIYGIESGIIGEYHKLIDAPQYLNDNAHAYGFYLKKNFAVYSFPIRYERIDDNVTGTYLYGKGYTFTITPTKNVTKNIQLRTEFVYAFADAKIFKANTASSDKQLGFAFQFSWQF